LTWQCDLLPRQRQRAKHGQPQKYEHRLLADASRRVQVGWTHGTLKGLPVFIDVLQVSKPEQKANHAGKRKILISAGTHERQYSVWEIIHSKYRLNISSQLFSERDDVSKLHETALANSRRSFNGG
jgi:hypothetical protein